MTLIQQGVEGWEPIETAPIGEDNPVLVWDGVWITVAHCTEYRPGERTWWVHESYGFSEDGQISNPTHWMHLPEPPKP